MIAVDNAKLYAKFIAAVELLSSLDHTLADARASITNMAWPEEHGKFRFFYDEIGTATNLHKAAHNAMLSSASNLLTSNTIETFFVLTRDACQRAFAALEFANREIGNYYTKYLDVFKEAVEKAEKFQ
jgi:hypothetical protein